jgi:alpha-beta hydrolase superfamily lysophospholipase
MKHFFLYSLAVSGLVIAGCWLAGIFLVLPAQRFVGEPPAELNARQAEFSSPSGSQIQGWFVPGQKRGVIILMHCLRADRRIMLGRARFLHAAGYSILLFDFRAHGESKGSPITFGYLESRDAHAAVKFARATVPEEPVGIIGWSLGGAACLLGDAPTDADAIILEAVYPAIEEAIANRLEMRFGSYGRYLTPLFALQMRWAGIPTESLRPVEKIHAVRSPVLIIAGTSDRRTTLEESKRLFNAAPEPKKFWAVEGAAHTDLHQYAGKTYEKKVLEFFETAFKQRAANPQITQEGSE